MAIKSGQIITVGDGFLIDRLQSGGVSSLNIPEERIYELGNYFSLTTIRDIPDLSFEMESLETSLKTEAILCGLDPTTVTAAEQFAFTNAVPLTILSPFRSAQNLYNVINGVVIPHLSLESVSYKFGLKQSASQSFTLRGDSVFYIPGTPTEDKVTFSGQSSITLAQAALPFFNSTLGVVQHVVNISVYNPDGTFFRMFNGSNFDYTDSTTTVTFTTNANLPQTGAILRIHYGTTVAESIPQSANANDGTSVAPAAIRAKDIDVYIGSTAATPVFSRWSGVQSVDLNWKVNLDADQEFGNPLNVSMDYITPDVTGTINVKDRNVTDLFAKIFQATNVDQTSPAIAGTLSSTPVPLEIRLSNPDTGARLKTLYIPDARFEPPQINTRVNQKLMTPFKFYSDSGQMYVYDATPPADLPAESPGTTWAVLND